MSSVRNKGRPSGKEKVYFVADPHKSTAYLEEGRVSSEVGENDPPQYVDYEMERVKFNARLMLFMDAILDLSNEGTDAVFTFTEMKDNEPTLFWVSVVFLITSAVLRFSVAVRPLFKWNEDGVWNPPIKLTWKHRLLFVVGVLWSIIEPMTGQEIIDSTLDGEANKKHRQDDVDDNIGAKKAFKSRNKAQFTRNVGLVMLFLENIPEAVLDIIYSIRQSDVSTLFWVTLVLSIVHSIRVIAEIWFELKHLKFVPVAVRITDSNLDEMTNKKHTRIHEYCSVTADKTCQGKVQQVVDVITHFGWGRFRLKNYTAFLR